MKEISIGPLTFVGELAGSHVRVRVLGAGNPGHRPLCGAITVTSAEWEGIAATASAMLAGVSPDLAKARAELAGMRVLFDEQGKALKASRDAVASQRERLDGYMPIDSVIGDWDWPGIVRDGVNVSVYDDALEQAAKALAHISVEQLKNKEPRVDDESRCALCAWPIADCIEEGCVRGNCSMRPVPAKPYAPERAAKERDRG